MSKGIRHTLAVLAAGAWISTSEFLRNEVLLKSYWTEHYQRLGLTFPSEPLNGAVWGLWSMLFAAVVFVVSRRFDAKGTVALCWLVGFVLMWVVIGNLGVLPFGLLAYAVPLSLLECAVATWIVRRIAPPPDGAFQRTTNAGDRTR